MIAATNIVLLASVLASAGLFAAFDGSAPRKDETRATFSERFPREDEMFKPLVRVGTDGQIVDLTVNRERKGDKIGPQKILARANFCSQQQWPYIAPECLRRTDGSVIGKPNRTVEQRTADASTLVRSKIETLALR